MKYKFNSNMKSNFINNIFIKSIFQVKIGYAQNCLISYENQKTCETICGT